MERGTAGEYSSARQSIDRQLIATCNPNLRFRPLDIIKWDNLMAPINLGTQNGVVIQKKILFWLIVV